MHTPHAYHDQIRCVNGHIYWIARADAGGHITDHYALIDYNYLDPKPIAFHYDRDTLYSLQSNKNGDYDGTNLYQH